MDAKVAMKRRFSGVSWQHPAAQRAMPLIDGADRLVRNRRDLGDIPAYSIRIRGTGVSDEFGGRKFVRTGDLLTGSLVKYAGLTMDSHVLEIGSGAGRIPYSLERKMLSPGHYTGLDVDRVSIDACRSSQTLTNAGFTFIHADLESELYNSLGRCGTAASYCFPFDDETFDIVYLESVFTHLTGEECANYAREILRVLKAGGRAVVSGFLRDLGTGDSPFTFRHQVGEVFVEYLDNPRKAVAFDTETVASWFDRPHSQRLRGSWRGDAGEYPNGQDWLIMTK